jgi:hypothetical protein
MLLALTVKLPPNPAPDPSLLATMERFNAACHAMGETAFREHTASQGQWHHRTYRAVRERFGLSAQMAVRAIGQVVEAYQRDKTVQPTFARLEPSCAMIACGRGRDGTACPF